MATPTAKQIESETKRLVGEYIYVGRRRPKYKKDARNVGRIVAVDVRLDTDGNPYSRAKVLYPLTQETMWRYIRKADLVSKSGKYVALLKDTDTLRRALKNQRNRATVMAERIEEMKKELKEYEARQMECNEACDNIESFLFEIV